MTKPDLMHDRPWTRNPPATDPQNPGQFKNYANYGFMSFEYKDLNEAECRILEQLMSHAYAAIKDGKIPELKDLKGDPIVDQHFPWIRLMP